MGQESVHDPESVCVVQHFEEGWLVLLSFRRHHKYLLFIALKDQWGPELSCCEM